MSGAQSTFADGINWYTWTGYNYSLRKTVMKMRPQLNGPIGKNFLMFQLEISINQMFRQKHPAAGSLNQTYRYRIWQLYFDITCGRAQGTGQGKQEHFVIT